jgi:hypothetical protein
MSLKLKRFEVSWTKQYTASVYAPEETTQDKIKEMAEATCHEIDSTWIPIRWEVDIWDTGPYLELPDEERHLSESGFPLNKSLDCTYSLVSADDESQLVAPEEATWWLCESDSEEN